jgi:SAM-dependent methyltransferase
MEIKHRGNFDTEEQYRGIPVHAVSGCHKAVVDIVKRKVSNGGMVLDLGAGQGALTQRLLDEGFSVKAFDMSCLNWGVSKVKCIEYDLSGDLMPLLDGDQRIAAICVVEVIEHIENPRKFIGNLCSLAKKSGAVIVLTAPNPLDTFSSITHFTRGTFNWFSPAHYAGGGHISILPYWLIEEHFRYHGVQHFEWTFVGNFVHPNPLIQMMYRAISLMRSILSKTGRKNFHEGQAGIVTITFD